MSYKEYEALERKAHEYTLRDTQTQKNWEGSFQTSIGIIEHTNDLITVRTSTKTLSAKAIYLEEIDDVMLTHPLDIKHWLNRNEFLCELIHAGIYEPKTDEEKAIYESVRKRATNTIENIGKWRYAINIEHCLAIPMIRTRTQQIYYHLCCEIAHDDDGSYSFYNTNAEYIFGTSSFTVHCRDGKKICFYEQLTHRMFVDRLAEAYLYTLPEDRFFSLPGKGNDIDKYGYVEKFLPQETIFLSRSKQLKCYRTLNIEVTRENLNALNPKSSFGCGCVFYVKSKKSSDFYPFCPKGDYLTSISLTSLPYLGSKLKTVKLLEYFPTQEITTQARTKKQNAINPLPCLEEAKTETPEDMAIAPPIKEKPSRRNILWQLVPFLRNN
jgi:hypothetical protein